MVPTRFRQYIKVKKHKFPFPFCVRAVAFNSIPLLTYSLLINVGISPVEIAQDNDLEPHK